MVSDAACKSLMVWPPKYGYFAQCFGNRSGAYGSLLSLLVSNLSSTSSKNPGPMRAPHAKGCPRAPTVNKIRPITAVRLTTINLYAHVLPRPIRYVKPTAAIPPRMIFSHFQPK